MAYTKISELTALTDPQLTDIIPIVDDPSGTPITKKVTVDTLISGAGLIEAGWISIPITGSYSSGSVLTIQGDYSNYFTRGAKFKCINSSTKYGYIQSSIFSSPNTTINLINNSDYSLTSGCIISDIKISYSEPPDFPSGFNYTPIWTCATGSAPSIGDGTLTGRFSINGKKCFTNILFIAGNTTYPGDGGNWEFTIPTPMTGSSVYPGVYMGIAHIRDAGTNNYERFVQLSAIYSTTKLYYWMGLDNATNLNTISSTAPFTWGYGDSFNVQIEYEMNA